LLVVRQAVVGPYAENTWLVGDSDSGDALLLDPGGETELVLGLARTDFRVGRILATHGHADHIVGAEDLRERTGAPFQIHRGDEPLVLALPGQAARLGLGTARSPQVTSFLADGDTVRVGRYEGTVIHTPGHTRGGVSLHFPSEKALFTGDTLFAGSVGRTDLPGGNTPELLRSIRERLFPLGDDVRFFPGHGPGATLGEERRNNPYAGDHAPRAPTPSTPRP
jgi:glyoxylase-like metal-dependent hydrolase (beta-lactamase superfamily II)